MRRVPTSELRAFYAAVFEGLGVAAGAAGDGADALSYADRNGIDSHGAFNLQRIYVEQLETGMIDASASAVVASDDGPIALVDGQRALGLATARRAIDEAISRAQRWGVGIAAVRNSTHCGALGFYVRRAAAEGMVALATTNCGGEALLRPPGGAAARLGTNPIALAAPPGRQPQFCLDMSTAVVASGRVRLLAGRGEPIQEAWFDGAFAADATPASVDVSRLRFLGGERHTGVYKGYGLAILVDLLSGLLTGADVGPLGPGDGGIGHFFLVLSPEAFGTGDSFEDRLDATLASLRNAGSDGAVGYPGLPEDAIVRERERTGIPIDEVTRACLLAVAQHLDLRAPKDLEHR